jgi:hypothetical protein
MERACWVYGVEANVRYSNLIKKIREMSEAKAGLFSLAEGERVRPTGVKRRV